MKVAFLVTSAIDIDPNHKLGVQKNIPRAVHSSKERERQTLLTIATLTAEFPNADIFLLEGSNTTLPQLDTWGNFHPYYLKDHNPSLQQTILTHSHKSFCESSLLLDFISNNREKLQQYDVIFKVSGRYIPHFRDQKEFDRNKIYVKKPLVYEWSDSWGYDMVDLRKETNDNKLRQYSTVLFGFGNSHFDKFIQILNNVALLTNQQEYSHYDIETLLYYYSRSFSQDIIETDWMVSGFIGSTGRFVWY